MGFQEDTVNQIELLKWQIEKLLTQEQQKVSEIWESDGGAVALEADADGNISIDGQLQVETTDTRVLSVDYLGVGGYVYQTFRRGGVEKWWFLSSATSDQLTIQTPGGAIAVTALQSGDVGIGTTSPGQIFDVNQGGGNMIADGYDNHPSVAAKKENITAVSGVLDALVSSPPKTFRRIPFVSAGELRSHAIKTHLTEWMAEFGGTIEDGELVGDDYRGGKLKGIKNAKLLAVVDAEADRLRVVRRDEHKWKREYSGLVIDDENIQDNFPGVVIKDEAGEVTGWNVASYVACLHQSIIELVEGNKALAVRVEALEAS